MIESIPLLQSYVVPEIGGSDDRKTPIMVLSPGVHHHGQLG